MPDHRRTTCQNCGQPSSAVGPISWRGNCEECGLSRAQQSVIELSEHRGPMYRRWQRGMVIAIGDMLSSEARS